MKFNITILKETSDRYRLHFWLIRGSREMLMDFLPWINHELLKVGLAFNPNIYIGIVLWSVRVAYLVLISWSNSVNLGDLFSFRRRFFRNHLALISHSSCKKKSRNHLALTSQISGNHLHLVHISQSSLIKFLLFSLLSRVHIAFITANRRCYILNIGKTF